jgi:hypothetical protein
MAGDSKTKAVSLDELAKSLKSLSGFSAVEPDNIQHIHDEEVKKLAQNFGEVFNKKEHVDAANDFLKSKKEVDALVQLEKGSTHKYEFKVDALKDLDSEQHAAKTAALKALNGASETLAQLGEDARSAIVSIDTKISGRTGMFHTEGAWNAIKTHVNPTKGREAIAFGRIGGTAVCVLGLADGLFRDKTNNGEDRSVVTRFGEVAICALGAAALLLAGKSHLNEVGKALAKA